MNAKKAKALRKKMREVFGDEIELTGSRNTIRHGAVPRTYNASNLSGRRLYRRAKRIIKTGGREPLQDLGNPAD